MRPAHVGILAIEVYCPNTYVDQIELEQYDSAGTGKYTKGLGQLKMAVVGDSEDVNSIALTVTSRLLEKNAIDPHSIGRLEVGTETILDKSKSAKSVLMSLFSDLGNKNIEGITSLMACYGGTQALFNTVAWIESSAWDGRRGIVVCSDIAVYARGPARATGGAGAVAILIGPDAPIVLEPIRTSCFENAYDFYKPVPNSEYPIVDGHHSIDCYLDALSSCYSLYAQRTQLPSISQLADFFCFHVPFSGMARKAFNRLVLDDVIRNPNAHGSLGQIAKTTTLDSKDRQIASMIQNYSEELWRTRAQPSLKLSANIGNVYTGSLYLSLVALLCDTSLDLLDKRICMFSYGSGLASTLFTLYVRPEAEPAIQRIRENYSLETTLSQRIKLSPNEYNLRMDKREVDLNRCDYSPSDPLTELSPGTYYLERVDELWRRFYSKKQLNSKL